MHSCAPLVNMEHGARPQPCEHGGQCGDAHWELGVLHRHSEPHNHTSGLKRHNPQPQLPSSVQVRQRRRKGAFNLAEETQQPLGEQIFHQHLQNRQAVPGRGWQMVYRIHVSPLLPRGDAQPLSSWGSRDVPRLTAPHPGFPWDSRPGLCENSVTTHRFPPWNMRCSPPLYPESRCEGELRVCERGAVGLTDEWIDQRGSLRSNLVAIWCCPHSPPTPAPSLTPHRAVSLRKHMGKARGSGSPL